MPDPTFREADLYEPVRDLLSQQGFTVRGEVCGIDVLALRGDEVVAVEMKTSLNLDLVLQAVSRQRSADSVYVAVPRRGKTMTTKRWTQLCHLLQRLEIGLILVSPTTGTAEVRIEAVPFDRERSRQQAKRKKAALLEEFLGRTGDRNRGGVNRRAIVTVYREMAMEVARLIAAEGPCSARRLRQLGADPDKVWGILYDNHYGWFERRGSGIYGLTERGHTESAP